DLDLDDHVAAPAALQHWHAGAALAQLLAGLDAGRDVDRVLLAVEARDRDRAAERRRGKSDRHAGEQPRALALEHGVLADVDEDVEVAWRRAVRPRLSLSGEPDAGAGVDARRDFDGKLLDAVDPPFPAALAAGTFDDFAAAAAVVA